MNFKQYFTEATTIPTEWFHGTPHKIEKFSDDFVGQGHDQEGPGIYFTSTEEDASNYALLRKGENPSIFTVELAFKKLVPTKGKMPIKDIKQMIAWAKDLDIKLADWDEDKTKAMEMALKSILLQDNPLQAFLTVWYAFYRYEPVEFVRNMVLLGYDGTMVKREHGPWHAIVYNPKIIQVLDKHEL